MRSNASEEVAKAKRGANEQPNANQMQVYASEFLDGETVFLQLSQHGPKEKLEYL